MRALLLLLLAAPAFALDGGWTPPRKLSDWKLFEGNGSTQKPAKGVLPYDVNMALFSDYADKHRFIRLPPGAKMAYKADGPFALPQGSVLVKTFAYLREKRDASKGERLIETRLLVHRPTGWVGISYEWNDAQDEAELRLGGGPVDGVTWTHADGSARSLRYLMPNANQCKGCHEAAGRGSMAPLGVIALNVNRDGQLERWSATGALTGAPKKAPAFPRRDDASAPVVERARAYLAVNCAHCHNPKGTADTSGLDLSYGQTSPVAIGIEKTPVAAGRGTGGRKFDIVPGKPDASILVHRMESVEPGVMMPELGRRMTDEDGVRLVREWIASMGKK